MIESSKDFKERVQKRRIYSIGQTPPMSNTMSDGQSMSDPNDQVSDNPNPMRRKRQATENPVGGQEPIGQGNSGQGVGNDNRNMSRMNINHIDQLRIRQSESNWARKVIKNPAPIHLKLRSFNEGVLTDHLLYGLVNETIKKNLKRASGSVIESLLLQFMIWNVGTFYR